MVYFKKSLLTILLSNGVLSDNSKSSKFNYIPKNYLYSTKPFPDNSFCLSDCRFEGKFDLVSFTSRLILGLCLLELNLDFIRVLGIFYVEKKQ